MTKTEHDPDRPTWDKPSYKYAAAPLPNPGPVRASERIRIRQARRPRLTRGEAREMIRTGRMSAEKLAALRAKRQCRQSLAEFTKQAWHVLEPGIPLAWNWHIDVICEALEQVTSGEITRLLINVPPGHMKSLLVSVFWPAWVWLENPAWRSIYATYGERLSERDARRSKQLIESAWYRAQIPAVYGPKWDRPWEMLKGSTAVSLYSNEFNGSRFSTSVTAAGTGFRGDVLVVDDPMNVEEFPTEEALGKVISWFDQRMGSRFNDMATGRIVIIMQRLHANDLAGHVLAQDEANKDNQHWRPYTHIMLPAEFEPERASKYDRRTVPGELLFPAKFPESEQEIQKIKLGPHGYSAQHRQDPIAQGGNIFECWKLCFWYPDTPDYRRAPPPTWHEKDDRGGSIPCAQAVLPSTFDVEAQSWDCAFKDTDSSDFVAGHYYGRKGARIYLLERVHARLSYTRTKQEIRRMTDAHPRGFAKYVEDKANGPAVIDDLKDEIFGLEPVEPEGGKLARAWACSPLVSAGNLWLPHPVLFPWVKEVIAEMRGFPVAKNDDDVDAMTQALIKLVLKGLRRISAMTKL